MDLGGRDIRVTEILYVVKQCCFHVKSLFVSGWLDLWNFEDTFDPKNRENLTLTQFVINRPNKTTKLSSNICYYRFIV